MAARYRCNILDSSIVFGSHLKWHRVEKYLGRGFNWLPPLHMRVHGHGSLATGFTQFPQVENQYYHSWWMEYDPIKPHPEMGYIEQMTYLLSMVKFAAGGLDVYLLNERWDTGYLLLLFITSLSLSLSLSLSFYLSFVSVSLYFHISLQYLSLHLRMIG